MRKRRCRKLSGLRFKECAGVGFHVSLTRILWQQTPALPLIPSSSSIVSSENDVLQALIYYPQVQLLCLGMSDHHTFLQLISDPRRDIT